MTRKRLTKAVQSVLVLAMFGYTSVSLGAGTYDLVTETDCRTQLRAAVEAGINDNTAISMGVSDVRSRATAYASSARAFAAAVDEVRCPIRVAGAQGRLVKALLAYAALQDQQAVADVPPEARQAATDAVVTALDELHGLVGG